MLRRKAEHHIDVAEREVGVDESDLMPEARQPHGEIHRQAGLADAALAAGDGNACGARARKGRYRSHAASPMESASSLDARNAGVAHCKSSGTRCPSATYDTGRPCSRTTLNSGITLSASSSFVMTTRDGLTPA